MAEKKTVEVVAVEEVVAENTLIVMDAADDVYMAKEETRAKANSRKYWCTAHQEYTGNHKVANIHSLYMEIPCILS